MLLLKVFKRDLDAVRVKISKVAAAAESIIAHSRLLFSK